MICHVGGMICNSENWEIHEFKGLHLRVETCGEFELDVISRLISKKMQCTNSKNCT